MKKTMTLKLATGIAALLAGCFAVTQSAQAASQTWSNAPQNSLWIGSSNWIANAVPGGLNMTGNTVNGDTATFNSPLAGGIGGASNPILTDDATTTSRSRQIGTILFDTANVGAYVISNATMLTPTSSNGVLYVSHNGSIQMTAAVTNSQNILVPLVSRSPSSTDVAYNFINNSTNSSATLYISSATNGMGASRNTRWILGGANTGTNTVAALSVGTYTAGTPTTGGGIRKQGTGTWVLTGQNHQLGNVGTLVEVNEGLLIAQHVGVFGAAANVTVTSNAVLQLDGITLDQTFVNIARNGTIRMKGVGGVNGVAVSAAVAGISPTIATTSASDIFTVGTGLVANSIVSGGAADSVLNTTGPGSIVIGQSGSFANTYVGRWSFGAKTNVINGAGALGTGANANVAAGAIFDFSAFGATSFTPTTSGFGGSGTGSSIGTTAAAVVGDALGTLDLSSKAINLTFTPVSFSGDTTRPALVMAQGTLAIGGNTFFINNASGTPLGVGTYRLIQQASGSITSGGGYAALISGSGTVGGTSAAILVSGGNVDLVISIYVPKSLTWTGGNPDTSWDIATTANWLDGASPSVFNNSDNVTFNSIGSTNPSVNLVGTLAPATLTVDTSANDYTFGGVGQVAGTTSLIKQSAGVLNLNTVNTYAGGTVVSNGTLRVGANNAISSTGSGNVSVYGSGVIDLNGLNNAINGLDGNGSVDVQSSGASVLTLGNNDASGTFSGTLNNTSGTLGLVKTGAGSQTLGAANTHSGGTTVNVGTLVADNSYALGLGAVTLTGGTIDVKPAILHVGALTGSGGVIANNSTATTNVLVFTNGGDYSGSINNGTGGGGIAVQVLGGSLRLRSANNYSGGTVVASGASFLIGNNVGGGVTGGVIASNNATLGLPGGSTPPGTPTSITTVDGATVTFTSGAEGNGWGGQFVGSANTTNRFTGPVSANGTMSFANFLGVVEFALTGNFRFNVAAGGGDNTLFVFQSGNLHTRDSTTANLGAIAGGSDTSGIIGTGTAGQIGTYLIGGKNTDSVFHGAFSGNNNLVKIGTGNLTFDGVRYYTNIVTLPDTTVVNYTLFSNSVVYAGITTVSNGTLTVMAPNNLNNSTNVTLAGGTLDVAGIGTWTNQTTPDISAIDQPTNTVVVTTSTLDILSGQSLNGNGNITGNVNAQAGSTVNVGFAIGTIAVSGSVSLNGTVNMNLNRTNSPNNSDRITAASFSGSGATLNVTDVGPALFTGTVCQLFSGPVSAFTAVNLPASNGATTYTWTNKIALNGSIELLSGASPVNPNPTNITATVTGGGSTLELSWPASHIGWTLEAQTNSISTGLSGTWFTVPGSSTTNLVTMPINPANPTVFYRLKL